MSLDTKTADLLSNPSNLFNRISFDAPLDVIDVSSKVDAILHKRKGKPGRKLGSSAIPITEQVLIGVSARLEGSSKAARVFGVTQATADGYMDGSTQQGRRNAAPKEELKTALDNVLNRAKEGAADRILMAISSIQEEGINKLGNEKPLLAAELAVKLSTVVEKLTPRDSASFSAVQVIVYGPEERDESKYETMDVALNMEER